MKRKNIIETTGIVNNGKVKVTITDFYERRRMVNFSQVVVVHSLEIYKM